MFFLNYGNGHPGGVGTFTNYKTANEDGAWVALERHPHPTDQQYSWVNRLAELYSARTKNFCRHDACNETILADVRNSIEMYEFDQCVFFISLTGPLPRLFPIYGSWGSAKESSWSNYYDEWGLECRMDGTDFDYDKGRDIILEALKTSGIKKGDTTFTSYYDMGFRGFLNENGLNPDNIDNPLNALHPDNSIYEDILNKWLAIKEKEYLQECEKLNKLEGSDSYAYMNHDLRDTLRIIKKSRHKFFFYFSDILPGADNITEEIGIDTDVEVIEGDNIHWFWGISMENYFKSMISLKPRFLDYYQHEAHYDFYKYMRLKLTESKLML